MGPFTEHVANIFAEASVPNNLADTKAALALLHDEPSIYDQMLFEREGNPYAPKA
jgi:hypothetical protein